jgi:hypothetical protein
MRMSPSAWRREEAHLPDEPAWPRSSQRRVGFPAVADAHERFHILADHAIRDAFERSGLTPDDARSATNAIVAMVEGVHLHDRPRDPQARDDLARWVLHRFAP